MKIMNCTVCARIIFLLFFLSIFTTSFANEAPEKIMVINNNTFALELYAQLKEKSGNLFFSPYSISMALAMTYGGARGTTAEEMSQTLHFLRNAKKTHTAFAKLQHRFAKIQNRAVKLHIANALWPQQSYAFLPDYLAQIKRYYGAATTALDYANATEAARTHINTWVADKTQDKIQELIRQGDLDPLTTLVLVNAIYFKGDWSSQFNKEQTHLADFVLADNTKTKVEMMHQTGNFDYAETQDMQLLKLPYVGEDLVMLVVLPKKDKTLADIEAQLQIEKLNAWCVRMRKQEVAVFLPKFKISWGTQNLVTELQNLGMRKAFSGEADFSGMDDTQNLTISLVLHKAFVEVNEKGTEATAATAVVLTRGSSTSFKADHPFLFMIQDQKTGSLLFLGRVSDPRSSDSE